MKEHTNNRVLVREQEQNENIKKLPLRTRTEQEHEKIACSFIPARNLGKGLG